MRTIYIVLLAIGLALLPNIGGLFLGLFIVLPNLDPWFVGLQQPSFSPPSWLFAPAWSVLYCAIGIASFLVWLRGYRSGFEAISRRRVAAALGVYALQLGVNWLWVPVFFAWHQLMAAFVVIVVLDAVALVNAVVFGRISWLAGLFMVPYLLWLVYASYLNYALWQLNPREA